MNALSTSLNLTTATPAQLEAAADRLLGITATSVARSNATRADDGLGAQQASRLSRWIDQTGRPTLRAEVFLAGASVAELAAEALAPKRASISYADRKAATALAHKTRVRTVKATRATKAEAKALLAQAGQPQPLGLLAGECYCVPTRSRGFASTEA